MSSEEKKEKIGAGSGAWSCGHDLVARATGWGVNCARCKRMMPAGENGWQCGGKLTPRCALWYCTRCMKRPVAEQKKFPAVNPHRTQQSTRGGALPGPTPWLAASTDDLLCQLVHYKQLHGHNSPFVARTLALLALSDQDSAVSYLTESLQILTDTFPGHPNTATCRALLGVALLREGDARTALKHLTRALQILIKADGPQSHHTGLTRCRIGSCLSELGHHTEAVVELREGVDVLQGHWGDAHLDTATGRSLLGWSLLKSGSVDSAGAELKRALDAFNALPHTALHNKPRLLCTYRLAMAFDALKDFTSRDRLLREILQEIEETHELWKHCTAALHTIQ
eukprot:TRINITY_DN19957_c0_g1_i1.p1 TRINITY_DN19957_c0_g1~~TRINITY_DN19957_c0_g1_i1.p1  ORF type:complete len:360 (+),score=51.89 TRINITY_DN19957_c0_g1_i1:63-1082(+)